MQGTSGPENVSTRLDRIAELARKAPDMVLNTLAHHIDYDLLVEAHRRTNKQSSAGIDGVTPEQFGENLEANLRSLLERFKSGTYKAPPVKRVYIPKGDGKSQRPLGVPTFEDRVLQRAVSMILDAVYEQNFLDCSFGFRPNRSQHMALETLWQAAGDLEGCWVLEVDIKDFFGTINHGYLRGFLDQRIKDGVIRKAIDKWLKAGVLEDGETTRSDEGTPQGGVISPILANIYLHEVLDKWFYKDVRPCMKGRAALVRYADDAVFVFSKEEDARRVLEVLPKRFGKYDLTLHPEKTRLVKFTRPRSGPPDSGTFDFLGFTHYWALSRDQRWIVKRKTAKDRLQRVLTAISSWCQKHRHAPISEQHQTLSRKVQGHYNYYGLRGNSRLLAVFLDKVKHIWFGQLARRGQRAHDTWEWRKKVERLFPLPSPRVIKRRVALANL